jgi:hypothetical protein
MIGRGMGEQAMPLTLAADATMQWRADAPARSVHAIEMIIGGSAPPTPDADLQRASAFEEGRVLHLHAPLTLDGPVAIKINFSEPHRRGAPPSKTWTTSYRCGSISPASRSKRSHSLRKSGDLCADWSCSRVCHWM